MSVMNCHKLTSRIGLLSVICVTLFTENHSHLTSTFTVQESDHKL